MLQLSLEDLRGLLSQPAKSTFFVVGRAYLVRTVTHYYTGRLVAVNDAELLLEDAAWIADTGRYADSLASGSLGEVEPMQGNLILSRGAIVDAVEWKHALPRDQK
jgi:hypothetical protein